MISQDRALTAILQHLANVQDKPSLLAPAGTRDCPRPWEGRLQRKPWQYIITAAIPHLNTPEPLRLVIELLRRQTVQPYIIVIDTGSAPEICEQLEDRRSSDVEVHYLKAHSYLHPSAPVTVAMDVAFALCQTDYLFATHTDVFPRHRNLLGLLLHRLNSPEVAAVGYEMSPRKGTTKWKEVLSHTATLYHMRVMRRHGISWNLLRYFERGRAKQEVPGWPDTESGIDLCLKEAELPLCFIGRDQNRIRHIDGQIDHSRSYTGSLLYCEGTDQGNTARQQINEAMTEAQQRIEEWDRADR